jgi:hypothetical protein
MIKSLNTPISWCIYESTWQNNLSDGDDYQLEHENILFNGQDVLVTCNLWVEAALVNGTLGTFQRTFYSHGSKPHEFLMYIVVYFNKHIGAPWDILYTCIFHHWPSKFSMRC